MPNERKRIQMSHTPWLLVWVLSQCRLKARYSHSSFPPITYIKRESAGHTQLHDYTKAHSSTLYSFLTQWEKETFTAEGITNASDRIDSNIDFLFNSQLKSIKNSVYASIQWTYRQVRGLINSTHDRGIMLYTSRGATLSLTNFTSDPLVHQRIMTRTQSAG